MKSGNLNKNQTGFDLRDWVQIIAWIQTISGLLMLVISIAVGLLLGQQMSIINSPHNSNSGQVETDFILFASSELKMVLTVAIILTAAFFSSGLVLFIGVDKSHPWIYLKTSLISFLLLLCLAIFVFCKGASFAESLNNFSQISFLLGAVLISALSPSIILLLNQNYCQQNKQPNIQIMTSILVTKAPAFNMKKQNPVPWKKIFLRANHYFQSKIKNQNEPLPIPLIHGQSQSQVKSNNEY